MDADIGHISLGWLLHNQGKSEDAEIRLRQELEQDKNRLGPEHPEVVRDLYPLADALIANGKLDEAESTARQAVSLSRKTLGDRHFYTFFSLGELREVATRTGRLTEAEALGREQLAIFRQEVLPGNMIAVVNGWQRRTGTQSRPESRAVSVPGNSGNRRPAIPRARD